MKYCLFIITVLFYNRHEFIYFFYEKEYCITLVHSITLRFCRKLPGTKKNDTHTPGRSSHHQLQLRQLPQAEVRRDPPSTTLKDSKTLVRAAKASTMDHPRRLDSVERKQPSSQRGRKRKRIHPGDLGGTIRKEIPWSQLAKHSSNPGTRSIAGRRS